MRKLRPRLRGKIHLAAFWLTLPAGAVLVLNAPTVKAGIAAGIYTLTLMSVFGMSAFYHCITWGSQTRRWLRRLDHSIIYVFIGGTYIPFCLLILPPGLAIKILAVVWGIAVVGILQSLIWPEASRWKTVPPYIAMGLVGVPAIPSLIEAIGWVAIGLLVGGGLFHATGALIYARRRPNPFPKTFGYHEIFHVASVVGAAAHYALIALYVIPR